jgi:hypothetical protein
VTLSVARIFPRAFSLIIIADGSGISAVGDVRDNDSNPLGMRWEFGRVSTGEEGVEGSGSTSRPRRAAFSANMSSSDGDRVMPGAVSFCLFSTTSCQLCCEHCLDELAHLMPALLSAVVYREVQRRAKT